jgi:hypothetical protein
MELHEVQRTVLYLDRSRERQAAAHAHVDETTLEKSSDFALVARQPQPHRVCKGDGAGIAKVVEGQVDELQLGRHALWR